MNFALTKLIFTLESHPIYFHVDEVSHLCSMGVVLLQEVSIEDVEFICIDFLYSSVPLSQIYTLGSSMVLEQMGCFKSKGLFSSLTQHLDCVVLLQ